MSLTLSLTGREYHPHSGSCCTVFHTRTPGSLSYSSDDKTFTILHINTLSIATFKEFFNFSNSFVRGFKRGNIFKISIFLASADKPRNSWNFIFRSCCCYQLGSFTGTELVMIILSDIFYFFTSATTLV